MYKLLEQKKVLKNPQDAEDWGRELERLCAQAPQEIGQHMHRYTVTGHTHTHAHTLKTDNMAHHIAPLFLGLKERHATRLLR